MTQVWQSSPIHPRQLGYVSIQWSHQMAGIPLCQGNKPFSHIWEGRWQSQSGSRKPPLRGLGVQVCHSTPLLHLLQSAAPIWGEGVPRLPNNQGVSEHVQTPKGQKSIICTKSLSSLLCSFCLITALYNFLLFYHEGPRFKQNLTRQKRWKEWICAFRNTLQNLKWSKQNRLSL